MVGGRHVGRSVRGRVVLLAAAWTALALPALACAAIVVPEPTTLTLIGGSVVTLLVLRRMGRDK